MKTVSALILLVAASLSMAAQTYPSKEYVRLGSRVMAIEAPPTLLPSGESAAANNGETGTPIQITGSPNSSWSASTGAGAITLGATMGTTDSAGVATITYNLAGNAQQTAFTGYILVTMESGTAVYNITQLCCWSDSVTLTPTSANAPAKASNGSVTVGTASNNVSWTVTPQSCFNNSVSPLMGTGGGVISYSLVANTSPNPQTCSFAVAASGGGNSQTFTVTQAGAPGLSESNPTLTLTGPGTYSATVTADGVYTVNVLNWTGWQVTVTAGGAGGWLSTQNITSSSAQYKISGGAGTGTLTFTDGTTTLTVNVTESTSGGSCSSTPTLSLNKSSMSFTAAGGSGQQTSTYSATITSNTNWTASCSNADQEGLTFYVSGNSNTGICTVPLTGSGNQTLYVDLTYNHANPPTALSTTLNVTTCGGSAAKSANITVSQGAETFTVTPSTQTIYQDFDNAPTQFTAYFDGGLPLPTGYTVTWSLSTGDVIFAGGAGASPGTYGGGGGGSGGSTTAGNPGSGSTGATAVTGGGPGGKGATTNGNGNSPVSGPGGGGGGCYETGSGSCNGGNGFAGQIKLTYTSALSPGTAASITATAGTPQSAGFGTAFATALQAAVLDIANNPVSGATVTFTAPSSGATATFAGSATATATTNSSGVATAPTLTANTTLGSYIVTANVSSVPTSASFSLTNTILTLTSGATWTAPAGVTSIQVECVGGGGGGYGNSGDNNGGGGGAYARRNAMAVTPGNIYSYTIGAGGSADTNGGTTTFTGDGGVQCVAAAGKSSGGGGTTARSTGDVVFAGGAGFSSGGSFGGGGGGSGGSASAGNTSSGSPGGAAVTGGGPGGNGATNANGNSPVSGPGGGGGGCYFTSGSCTGGSGANGQITITIE